MSILRRLFSRSEGRERIEPLYRAIVAEARRPDWYRDLAVPDTLDGRFDMVVAVLAAALVRLETAGEQGASPAALLTEHFVQDMDGQLREDGIGDVVVGKHIGRMVSALGGRISAYRPGLKGEGDLEESLARNLYRSNPPPPAVLAKAAERFRDLYRAMSGVPAEAFVDGRLW